jgi:hypothetical protein
MKLIFLDIDGVLITTRSMMAKVGKQFDAPTADANTLQMLRHVAPDIDPVAVGILNRVTRAAGAKIVLSSTHRIFAWRNGRCDLEQVKAYLQALGIEGEVIGATPRFDNGVRGQEIDAWLEDNQVPSDAKIVIIDDDSDMLPHQMFNFIQTKFDTGLSMESWQQLVKLLDIDEDLLFAPG